MKFFKGWVIVIVFIFVLIGGFFLLKKVSSGPPSSASFAALTIARTTTEQPSLSTGIVPEGFKEYHNDKFGFSLYYPQELEPQEFEDRGPELTVLFQKGEGQAGFQIYVAPIEGSTISDERFLRDAPSGVRKDPKDTSVAGVPAVSFQGFDAKIGQTHEVWFIGSKQGREVPNFLYEVSTYKELEQDMGEILKSWRFI